MAASRSSRISPALPMASTWRSTPGTDTPVSLASSRSVLGRLETSSAILTRVGDDKSASACLFWAAPAFPPLSSRAASSPEPFTLAVRPGHRERERGVAPRRRPWLLRRRARIRADGRKGGRQCDDGLWSGHRPQKVRPTRVGRRQEEALSMEGLARSSRSGSRATLFGQPWRNKLINVSLINDM